jgi:hypothetical protein
MTARLQINNNQETLYNQDYYQWLIQTAKLLKEKKFTQLTHISQTLSVV